MFSSSEKTAAHAIPKLAETDRPCREELISIISRLLADKESIKYIWNQRITLCLFAIKYVYTTDDNKIEGFLSLREMCSCDL